MEAGRLAAAMHVVWADVMGAGAGTIAVVVGKGVGFWIKFQGRANEICPWTGFGW